MDRSDVQAFAVDANTARNAVYGVAAQWNGRTILLACHVISDLELAAGGYERSGTVRAIYAGLDGPRLHDSVMLSEPQFTQYSQRWVVKSATPSEAHNSTSYTLEPIP